MAQKTKAALQAENAVLRRARRAESFVLLARTAFHWLGTLGVVYLLRDCILALAGKTTLADIAISILGNANVSVVVTWSVAGTGAVYGLAQRRLRRRTVERLQERIATLERAIDSRRSSSSLTTTGDTNPRDL